MKMRAVRVAKPGAPLELVTQEVPEPKPGRVRIKVQACGICHSDALAKDGLLPGIAYPISPGHEVAGIIDEIGDGVTNWRKGQRVGIGWHGGHDGTCDRCRSGDFISCRHLQVTGLSFDGGYAEYMTAPVEALAGIPDGLSPAQAAPLLCAGVTTFNALRHSGARAGDLVAILGIGGLGHLGVQFAAKMGFETVAIARGADKASFAKQLGAQHYIDSTAEDVSKTLSDLGGARVVLATAANSEAMSATINGLSVDGVLIVVGASAEPIKVTPGQLIMGRKSLKGWPSGTAQDSTDTLAFSVSHGVRPMIERYPLERAAEAYDRMMSGEARFRVVLETE